MTRNGEERRLPDGWCWVPFGEVAEHRLGKMLDKRKNRGTPRPYLRNVNVRWHGFDLDDVLEMRIADDEIEKYTVRKGDLVICEGGEPGRAAIWQREEPMAYQKALHRARPREGVEAKYLLYMLEDAAGSGRLAQHFTGSTINHLTGTALAEVQVPLAPLAEQRRIVEKIEELFSDLDAGVQALEAVRRRLDRYRQSVLKAAVEGALTRDWRAAHPDVEPASVLLGRVLEERRARWEADQLAKYEAKGKTPPKGWRDRYQLPEAPEADELPGLPEGWVWTTLEQITDGGRLVQYGILKPGKDFPGGVPYVKVMNMRGDRIDVEGLKRTSPKIAANYERASLEHGDLLLSIRGTYGRVAVVPDVLKGANITQDSVRIAPATEVDRDYLATHLRAPATQNYFKTVAKGVAVKGVNVGDVRLTPIALPPLAEQEAIVEEVERRLSVVDAVAAEVDAQTARAGRLRRAILQHAFAGRLVPQDPNDEPASVLLDRLREARVEAPAKRKRRASRPQQGELSFRVIDRR